ncbi:MAG: hypothetical protein AB1589_23090 [Cyanobacteriota bacterium]
MAWTTKASDNFNRADETPIQSPWILSAQNHIDIFNNVIVRNINRIDSSLCRAFLGNSVTYNQRQASIAQVDLVATLGIRCQDVDNCYLLTHSANGAVTYIQRLSAATPTTLASATTGDINATSSHYWFFGADGTSLKGTGVLQSRAAVDTVDDVLIANFITATDATYGSGKAQIVGSSRTSTNFVDDWEGLEFSTGSAPRIFPRGRALNFGGFVPFAKGRIINSGGF